MNKTGYSGSDEARTDNAQRDGTFRTHSFATRLADAHRFPVLMLETTHHGLVHSVEKPHHFVTPDLGIAAGKAHPAFEGEQTIQKRELPDSRHGFHD